MLLFNLIMSEANYSNKSNQSGSYGSNDRRRRQRKHYDRPLMDLGFGPEQVIYGEVTRPHDGIKGDAKLYVVTDGKLYVYSCSVYQDRAGEYRRAAINLFSSNREIFETVKVSDNLTVNVNREAELEPALGSLIYKGKYRVDCSTEEALQTVKDVLKRIAEEDAEDEENEEDEEPVNDGPITLGTLGSLPLDLPNDDDEKPTEEDNKEDDKAEEAAEKPVEEAQEEKEEKMEEPTASVKKAETKKTTSKDSSKKIATKVDKPKTIAKPAEESAKQEGKTTKKEERPTAESQMETKQLVDKISAVQKVAKRIVDGNLNPRDAMEVILTVGEASTDLLCRLLPVEAEKVESTMDQLRLMHALGYPNDDGTYPILIDSIDKLVTSADFDSEAQKRNYGSVVHSEKVGQSILVYDLDEMFMVKVADEFIEQLAAFCRATPSPRVKQLFRDNDTVKASQVLQLVSDDDEGGLNVADYDLYHSYVTKYMLAADWLIDNPTDGYPWAQFQVKNTMGLTIDAIRYLVVNINWLVSIFKPEQLKSLLSQVNNLNLNGDATGEALRKALNNLLVPYLPVEKTTASDDTADVPANADANNDAQ